MAVELDHFFVCAARGAPEAERLIEFGLAEGAPNEHPGQGTANRRFFFHNAMLELLWVNNPAEAQHERTRRTRLWERWSERHGCACPFGFCIRSADPASAAPPFPAWEYRPLYLPAAVRFYIAAGSLLEEPMWVYAEFARGSDAGDARQPAQHPIGFRQITSVRLTSPAMARSVITPAMAEIGLISLRPGKEHTLEVEFDGNRKQRISDFRPILPLVFRW